MPTRRRTATQVAAVVENLTRRRGVEAGARYLTNAMRRSSMGGQGGLINAPNGLCKLSFQSE